jgi:NAD(P)-dependent dehydrogenase (short-subunit alcohol dehydrogenase family)
VGLQSFPEPSTMRGARQPRAAQIAAHRSPRRKGRRQGAMLGSDGGRLTGKVAVVTGASKGIGRALAVGLAGAGASVVVNYKRDAVGAQGTRTAITQAGGTAEVVGADVAARTGVEGLVDSAVRTFGRLDIMVNNAARTRFGPVDEVTEEDFDDVVNTILRSTFFGSVAAARAMRRTGGGTIINVSSISVRGILPFHSVYTMAKGAAETLTRQFAVELAPMVRVNAIGPTATATRRNLEYDPDFEKRWAAVIPKGRIAQPEDYVGAAVFFASDESAMVTGQILYVDGGWALQGRAPDMTQSDFSGDRLRD